ncbi:MAG: hypothetical protein WD005_01320 [Haliea sp.]
MPKLLSLLAPDELKQLDVVAFVGPVFNLGTAGGSALVVTANTVTMSRTFHRLSATGTTVQRSLRTINGGTEGDVLVLRKDADSLGNIIIDDAAGNIQSAGNFTLTSPKDLIAFLFDGTDWCELCRSNNA